ncbi:MAG: hypothetical protein Q9170_006281 [Blastenia crenularia]
MTMSGLGTGGDPECKMSMLWNWYTVDACFIAWRVKSKSEFVHLCIATICLVIFLEFLHQLQRKYDAYLKKQYHLRNVHPPQESITKDIQAGEDHDQQIPKSRDLGYGPTIRSHVQTVLQHAFRALISTLILAEQHGSKD